MDAGYNFSFKKYDEADGLQGKQFNENAALQYAQRRIDFRVEHMVSIFFRPEDITVNTTKPEIVLTDLQVLNKSVGIQ